MSQDNPSCPICPGVGRYLGSLGKLDHFRCESCGVDFQGLDATEDDAPESAGRYDDPNEEFYGIGGYEGGSN